MAIPTRSDDELALEWIKLRVAGKTSGEIAERYKAREEWVRVVTNRILASDVKHSGPGVAVKYWRRMGGARKRK